MITQIHPFPVEEVYQDIELPEVIEETLDLSKYTDGKFPENTLHVPHLWMDRSFATHQFWFNEVRFLRYFIGKYMK
jgi:hypothetical protein